MKARVILIGSIGVALMLGAVARSAGTPGPTFARAHGYVAGGQPGAVSAGDLDGDGRPDLVTANHAGEIEEGCGVHTLSVLRNRGRGTFTTRRDLQATGCPLGVAIGDLNGDGRQDLVSANWSDPEDPDAGVSTVSVFLNQGKGSFAPRVDYLTGPGAGSIAIADLNGDRLPDVATGTVPSFGCADVVTVSVLLNNGDGTLGPRRNYRTGSCPSLVVGDLDSNNTPDLVTANDIGNTISMLHNRGDGTFGSRRDYHAVEPESIALGDLDRDGRLDVVTAVVTANVIGNGLLVLYNRGQGTFLRRSYPTGPSPTAVRVEDIDGDRRPDVVYAHEADSVSVLRNAGGGRFLSRLSYWGAYDPVDAATADFDGDGRQDLAVASHEDKRVVVSINRPGLCNVQYVKKLTLAAARATLARANCRVGRISRAYSSLRTGLVTSEKPDYGEVRRGGARVDLVVSRGRRR